MRALQPHHMQFHSWHYQQLASESNINNAKGKALLNETK
jgi:hypothetical protein